MTATHDNHDDDNRCVCNVTSSFYIENNGDPDGNRHPIKNDVVITIWSLSLITPPFAGDVWKSKRVASPSTN